LVLLWRSIAHVAQAADESELAKAATEDVVHSPPL